MTQEDEAELKKLAKNIQLSKTYREREINTALLKRKINPEDCGRDVIQKIDSLVEVFREVAEQEEE